MFVFGGHYRVGSRACRVMLTVTLFMCLYRYAVSHPIGEVFNGQVHTKFTRHTFALLAAEVQRPREVFVHLAGRVASIVREHHTAGGHVLRTRWCPRTGADGNAADAAAGHADYAGTADAHADRVHVMVFGGVR